MFKTFADNFELTLDALINKNPFLITVFSDFIAKEKKKPISVPTGFLDLPLFELKLK